jgi:precorrin-6A/cobalt-precorrin-6A reductase
MILLLGGTSDGREIAMGLAHCGCRVLVSRATAAPLSIGLHPLIDGRFGALDDAGLESLIRSRGIRLLVDAAHPYAAEIHERARRMAAATGTAYLSFVRPPVVAAGEPGVEFAADHAAAAACAFAHGRPVLLTTGSKHLAPYVAEADRTGLRLVVRVLDYSPSVRACRAAGLAEDSILLGCGPYSVATNRRHIRDFAIGCLVMKDSGLAGGTHDKLEAARREDCRIVVVRRPDLSGTGVASAAGRALAEPVAHGETGVFHDVDSLVRAAVSLVGGTG